MARRVNTKFLIIFSVIVVGGIGSAFIIGGPVTNWYRGDRGKKLIVQADALVKEADAATTVQAKKEKLENAVRDYQQAVGVEAKNPELLLKLGDAYNKLTQFDVNVYINNSRQAWEKALELDPAYLPALRRLRDSYYQETLVTPVATFFSRLEERATAIHKLDPADLKSHALMYIAPIHQWLAEIETPSNKIETAIVELSTLIEKNPTSPELADMVYHVAAAKAKKGFNAKSESQDRVGDDLIDSAIKTFQAAIAANDQDATLHYKFYELLRVIKKRDPERDNKQRYTETSRAELDKAKALITPEQEDMYVKINIAAHQLAMERRVPAQAEKILLDLQAVRPDDQRVRLALARLWRYDRAKQGEAIRLLELPMSTGNSWEGVEARQKIDLEVQSTSELTNMYIERYAGLPEAERPKALKQIEDTYDKLYAKARERSFVLKIRGKLEMLHGGPDATIKAIQTFEKAQSQFRAENVKNLEDPELTFLLARAYFASHQTGQAKQQLLKYKERNPDYYPVRLMLAQVLIAEGDIAQARENVDFLVKVAPEEPDVIRLALAVSDPVKDAMGVKALYEKLPETNRGEQMLKAQVASLSPVNNLEDSVRLYRKVLEADPADFDALQSIRQVLLTQNKKTEAEDVLKKAQAAKPDDKRIALLLSQIAGATPEKMIKDALDLFDATITDKLALELKKYEFLLLATQQFGNQAPKGVSKEAALAHLVEAERINPDDGRVLDLMFQHHLGERNWAKAGEYVEKLATKNYDQANGLIYRYRLAMTRGDVQAGLGFAQEMTDKLREFARSWVFLGQALQSTGQYESAITNAYSVALDKQSENPEAIAGIITCYLQLNRPADALRYIDLGRKAHPNNPYFRDQWANFHMQWGDPSRVIKPAQDDRDANPNDPNKWVALGRAQYAAARKAGPEGKKFLADAKATFAQAQKQFPGERVIWAFLAEIADAEGKPEDAEATLKGMVAQAQFKDGPEPMMMLADHYLRAGKAPQAEATMREAINRFNDNNEVKRRLAAYFTQAKKYDEALKLLDPASNDKLVRQQIVEIYMLAGKFNEAETLLRGLLTGSPQDAQLHALLGVVLLNQNKESQATDSLTAALSIDPKNQAALYTRGQIRLKAKTPQLDEAIKDLIALRDVNANHVEARVLLADAFRQKQQFDSAERELEEALRRAPGRRDIRMTLAGLYAGARPPAWGEAERLVVDAERQEPKEALWKRMLAKMYSARNMHERAVMKIREAMEADPKNGEIVKDYFDVLEAGKYYAQMITETERVLASDKNMADKGWWVYVKRAIGRGNTGLKKEAMADFEKALEIVQADKEISQDVQIAIIDKIKEHMGIEKAIDRVMMLANAGGPQATRWKVALAYLYLQDGNPTKAASTIEEARTQAASLDEKNQLSALNVAGNIYMTSKSFDAARTVYEELLGKRPDDLGALNNLACIMAEHVTPVNMPMALQYSQRAYDQMTKQGLNDPNVLDTIGWVNVLAGPNNIDRGIDFLNSSLKAGEIPEAHYHLAEALLIKKLPDAAMKSLNAASELIQKKKDEKQLVDEKLRERIGQAMLKAESASRVAGQ